MLIAVSYDVVDDERRQRLHDRLKDFGRRVQYSVFECLLGEGDLARMETAVTELVNQREDSVRIYLLCQTCAGRIRIIGVGTETLEPGEYVV